MSGYNHVNPRATDLYLRSPLPSTPAERAAAAELVRRHAAWQAAGRPSFAEWRGKVRT